MISVTRLGDIETWRSIISLRLLLDHTNDASGLPNGGWNFL